MIFRAQKSFDTRTLTNDLHRAAAEVVDEHVGRKKGDHRVTEADLQRAAHLLEQHQQATSTGRPELSPFPPAPGARYSEADILELGLPALRDYLRSPQEARLVGPFCTAMRVDAIRDPQIRSSAALIAERFGSSPGELTLEALRAARAALRITDYFGLEAARPDLAPQLQARRGIDDDAAAAIERFMQHGKGGLVSHGPAVINGRTIHEVFRLPVPTELNLRDEKVLLGLVEGYERRVQSCGYDRIYLRGDDGGLFVALNRTGSVANVLPHFRVGLGPGTGPRQGAEVVRVVEVNNSLGEATLGFWAKLLRRATNLIRDRLASNLDRDLTSAAAQITDGQTEPNKARRDLRELLIGAGMTASVGAAFFNLPGAVALASGTGGLVTAMNVIDYLSKPQDLAPVYHAVGVTVNRAAPIVY